MLLASLAACLLKGAERVTPMLNFDLRGVEGKRSGHWRWQLEEVFVMIDGARHYLWRAVDHARAPLDATERSFRVRAADGTMRTGTVGGEAIAFPAGRYGLLVDGLADPVPVEVAPDSQSLVDLAQ